MLSPVQLFATSWTLAQQVLLSIGFSSQEYWSGLPFPLPGNLPDPGMESRSPAPPALAGRFFTTSATWEALLVLCFFLGRYMERVNLGRWLSGKESSAGDAG